MADPTKTATHTTAADLPFLIEDMEDNFEYLNILVYSIPGGGKTTLMASAADVDEMADVLMLDIESGALTIKDNDRIKRKDRINTIRIKSFKQLARVHEFLKAHCRLRDSNSPDAEDKLRQLEAKFRGILPKDLKKVHRYRSVMIDSLTELDSLCIYELLGFSTDMKLDDALKDGEMEVAEWAEYKKNNQMMQLIVRAYRDLPMHALFVCHVAYTQDELKRFHYAPQLTGKLRAQAQGFVDIVGYLQVGSLKEGEKTAARRLWIQPVGKFDAKNRIASFKESFVDDPTMADVWEIVTATMD